VSDTQKSIEFFQQALKADPTYALAYAGLAESYLGLSGMYLIPKEAMAKARAAATRTIELDPRLVEAHVSKGVIEAFLDFAWRESQEELERAIQLKPYDAAPRFWYEWNLVLSDRADDGIAQAQRARELDPLSAYIEAGLAQMYYCAGQPQVGIQRLRSVVAADLTFFNGRYLLRVAYLYTAQYADAIREPRTSESTRSTAAATDWIPGVRLRETGRLAVRKCPTCGVENTQ
jgi:eukaryotic-like serine/threonine-protein kinase